MWKLYIQFFSFVTCCLSVFVVLEVSAKDKAFVLRFDDNHSPYEWRRVADIFERRAMRCSFAVNSAGLSEEQGECLRELSSRGHIVMDHTPNHSFYKATYHDEAAFERAKKLPFVRKIDCLMRTLYFGCEKSDAHPMNRKVRANIKANIIMFPDGDGPKKVQYVFVGMSGGDEIWGLKQGENGLMLLDFWRRPLKKEINILDCELIVYDQAALQPSDDLLRELASITCERFDHFGLPRPRVWVRPGGWDPGISWMRLEHIYGREFGYNGADSRIDGVWRGSRWTTGYDEMYFFDQGADITPEELVGRIRARLTKDGYYVLLTHMTHRKLPGGLEEYLQKTERFAQLIVEQKIPTMTMPQFLDMKFGELTRDGHQ